MANRVDLSLNRRSFLAAVAGAAGSVSQLSCRLSKPIAESQPLEGFIVPNFHPASCGWLTNFSNERVYCANSYLDHLDRVRDDPTYKFVLSECNNLIAIMNFQPARIEEIKQRAREGRVELVNASFLEMTINLSGGEALIKEGVEGLRWQEQVMGVSPRIAWTIDACGTHDQMGQLCAGLGLEAMVYSRMNPTGSNIHWAESPDGSRILAFCPGGYCGIWAVVWHQGPLVCRANSGSLRMAAGKGQNQSGRSPHPHSERTRRLQPRAAQEGIPSGVSGAVEASESAHQGPNRHGQRIFGCGVARCQIRQRSRFPQ